MKEFKDRVIVITGAASGIGFALAEKAAALGMKIVMTDIDAENLAQAAGRLQEQGAEVAHRAADVAKAEEIEALAQLTVEVFGTVHIVCNNAGVSTVSSSWEHSIGDWQWVLGVNLWGIVHSIRSFVPRMLASGHECHVVNTSSMAGITTGGFMSSYFASKHAAVALTEALYKELAATPGAENIGVSLLCPGSINTNIRRAERHRPPDLKRSEAPPSPGVLNLASNLRSGLAVGFPPSYVADQVFDAIRDRKFYVFPAQEHYFENIKLRHREIETQTNPSVRALTGNAPAGT